MQHNLIAVLCCSFFLPLAALAVEPPFIVDESEQEFTEPKKGTDVKIPDQKALSTAPQVRTIKVEEVQFHGGSVFSLQQLAKMTEPLLGRDVTKKEIVTVLRAITARYKQAGYALSYALLPEQITADGVLTIVLVEGYIARQEIVIEDEDVRTRVARLVTKMQAEKPLTTATFERYLKLIEMTPGYKFKVRVPKPKTFGGGTTVRVEEVSSEWIEGSMGLDDGKEEDLKLLPSVSFNSLSTYGDSLSATALLPNDSVESYYALNYQQDLGSDGLRLMLSANHFEAQGDDRIFVADIPLDYQENKQRDSLRAGVQYPLQLSRKSSWWLGGKLHYLDEEAVYALRRQDGLGHVMEIEKALRYSALEIHSNWTRQFTRQVVRLAGSIKQGIELGDSKNSIADANGARQGSETIHFNSARLDALWRYMLTPRWRIESKLNLFWSDDVLPSAEQIRYGGARYGRGYADGQAQGDRGAAVELEVRYRQPVLWTFVSSVEPYLVFDAARAELNANDRVQELASAAMGMDISYREYYRVGLEFARPLGDPHVETDDRSLVYSLRLRWQF